MKRLLAIALILGAFVTLIGLGTWQMQRLAWKEGLIEQAQNRPNFPAEPLDALVEEAGLLPLLSYSDEEQDAAIDALAYRRASLEGEFFGEPIRVFTTLSDANGLYDGPGYWIMQGFETQRSVLFVNRGFVPFELPNNAVVEPAPDGIVRFEGLIRPDDAPDRFTPDPDYTDNLLYRRSVDQLAQASGVSVPLPITVDMPAQATDRLPQAGETKFAFSNRHFEYMLTWYGLAAVLVGVVGTVLFQRRGRGSD